MLKFPTRQRLKLWCATLTLLSSQQLPFCVASSVECCPPLPHSGTCEDGHSATPCCGYGPCVSLMPPCCGCDRGCRSLDLPPTCSKDLMPQVLKCIGLDKYRNFTSCRGPTTDANDAVVSVYDFGWNEMTVSGVGISGNLSVEPLAIMFSHDGKYWQSEGGRYSTDGAFGTLRLSSGYVTARFFQVYWNVSDEPASFILYGCDASIDIGRREKRFQFTNYRMSIAFMWLFPFWCVPLGCCIWYARRRFLRVTAEETTDRPLLLPPNLAAEEQEQEQEGSE